MTEYRSFLNVDPPALAEIWQRQPPLRGMIRGVTPEILERFVFSKPYFNRSGLIVAMQDNQMVGFVHAGFGPAKDMSRLSCETGVISQLLAFPSDDQPQILSGLLNRSEDFLNDCGAQTVHALAKAAFNPFYFGFYGGSCVSGVLESDATRKTAFAAAGYQPASQWVVLHRSLTDFRIPVDRKLLRARRATEVGATAEPPANNWCDACLKGSSEHVQFTVSKRDDGAPLGEASFWNMELFGRHWNMSAVGLSDLRIMSGARREGYATLLLGESLRHLQANGVAMVEVQIPADNDTARGLFDKLGFVEVDRTTELWKAIGKAD